MCFCFGTPDSTIEAVVRQGEEHRISRSEDFKAKGAMNKQSSGRNHKLFGRNTSEIAST